MVSTLLVFHCVWFILSPSSCMYAAFFSARILPEWKEKDKKTHTHTPFTMTNIFVLSHFFLFHFTFKSRLLYYALGVFHFLFSLILMRFSFHKIEFQILFLKHSCHDANVMWTISWNTIYVIAIAQHEKLMEKYSQKSYFKSIFPFDWSSVEKYCSIKFSTKTRSFFVILLP